MTNSLVETLIGALVLTVAGAFLAFAYSTTDMRTTGGYDLSARFNRVDGITVGTDVRIAGIKVGAVTGMVLDTDRYVARIGVNIADNVKLPTDSQIKIASEGLLGGSYLAIEPGGNEDYLAAGDEFEYTQGTVDLMGLISQAIFSLGGDKKDKSESQ